MLDFKLAGGMDKMLNNGGEKSKRVKQKVGLQMEAATRENRILKGRQIVWMVCESFKTHDRSDLLFSFDHLAQVEVRNHDLHDFMVQWNHVLDSMGHNAINDIMLRDVFFRKIQKEKALLLAVDAYENFTEFHPGKTYKWLLGKVEDKIRVQEQRKNMLEKEQLLNSRNQPPGAGGPAAPAKEKEDGKGSDKKNKGGKNGKRDKSQDPPPPKAAGEIPVAEGQNQPFGAGKGKGGKKGADGGKGKGKADCYFFHVEKACRSGDQCKFSHEKISEAVKKTLVRPGPRSREPSSEPPPTPTAPRRPSSRGPKIYHC
jgi:hypothetical protein